MAGRLTMEQARKALQELHPDRNVTVEPFDMGDWELLFDLPFGPGRRRSEIISARELQMNDRETMLRQLDYVIRREVGKSEQQGSSKPPEAGRLTMEQLKELAEAMSMSFPREYLGPQKPPVWLTDQMYQAAKTTNDAIRIADMSLADYVAELHVNLDPRGKEADGQVR